MIIKINTFIKTFWRPFGRQFQYLFSV